MSDRQWGPGDPAKRRYLNETNRFQDGTPFRLFFGEHPHSRSDKNIYADLGDDNVVGFDGHRVRTKIVVEEANYLKASSFSGSEVRKQCWADIHLDDKMVYRVTDRRTAVHMLLRARIVLGELFSHPVQLWRPDWDGLIGRKVYYRTVPAVVAKYWPEQGSVWLDAAEGAEFVLPPWCTTGDDEQVETGVKEDFFSDHIWWFRKD